MLRLAELEGSTAVTVEDTFHQVHFSVEPTRIAAQAYATLPGFVGSTAQDLTGALASLRVERMLTSSAPVGTRAYAVPTEVNPFGGQLLGAANFAIFFVGA
jgi:hypothetical protein